MSIWGRLAEAARDFSVRGQISSMLAHEPASEQRKPYPEQDNEVPFTVGVIVLSAKMAKADGIVAADEVKAFKEAFKVSPAEMKHAAPVFNSAKRDSANFETCAEQLVTVFKGNRKLLEDVLEGLFHISKADDQLHPREEKFLHEVARRFGISDTEFAYIKARHVAAAKRNPYDVLGINPQITNDALKAHYRKLVADNHPDKLIARGVPKEFVAIATEKIAAINEAYGQIAKERGI